MHLILEGIYWENYEQTGFRQIYLAKAPFSSSPRGVLVPYCHC